MEASALNTYARVPESGEFPVPGHDPLPVAWNKSAFTGRFFQWVDDELERLMSPLRKERERLMGLCDAFATEAEAVERQRDELNAVDTSAFGEEALVAHNEGLRAVAEQAARIDEQLRDVTRRLTKLRADTEQAQADLYARALAGPLPFGLDRVLLSWELTEGGRPVEVTFDYLRLKAVDFLVDLLAFCRRESLPKQASEKKTEASTGPQKQTTGGTTESSSPETRSTRRRGARRDSASPQTLPSSASSAVASSNTTLG